MDVHYAQHDIRWSWVCLDELQSYRIQANVCPVCLTASLGLRRSREWRINDIYCCYQGIITNFLFSDTSVTVAGKWCRDLLEPLLNDKESSFWDRTLVLITFDETETYPKSNRVFSILLGDAVPEHLKGTSDDSYYNHYSEISTVEANWDLHTLGRFDVGANVFKFVGEKTGDHVRPWDAATGSNPSIFFNSSYAGPLNEDFDKAPYEAPNVHIRSPGSGRTVLPAIVEKWGGDKGPSPPQPGHENASPKPYGPGPKDAPPASPAPPAPPAGKHAPKPGKAPAPVKPAKGPASYYTPSVEIPDGQHPPPGYDVNDAQN